MRTSASPQPHPELSSAESTEHTMSQAGCLTVRSIESRSLGWLPILIASPDDAAAAAIATSKAPVRVGAGIHLVNAYTVALARTDDQYRDLLGSDAFNFPDGKPLSWATRGSEHALTQVRGPQFFLDVLDKGRERGVRHFLLGGSESTLLLLEEKLRRRYPGVEIVGTFSPPFRPMSQAERVEQDALILESGADIVWVGLGTPKQDYETERIARELNLVACAVGAAFDFAAGTKREAPAWMTQIGLEWLFRLVSEPRRLWKRYFFGNIGFLLAVSEDR